MAGVPALPAALAANALFQASWLPPLPSPADRPCPLAKRARRSFLQAQRIEEEGFGISWEPVEGAPRLRVSRLRAAATRKTLMPALLQMG